MVFTLDYDECSYQSTLTKEEKMKRGLKWTRNKDTMDIESRLADRAIMMASQLDIQYDKMSAVMDIDACHCNGNPLRLTDLLTADDTNFAHDVFGIRANINRQTGKLENCFVPRYSKS